MSTKGPKPLTPAMEIDIEELRDLVEALGSVKADGYFLAEKNLERTYSWLLRLSSCVLPKSLPLHHHLPSLLVPSHLFTVLSLGYAEYIDTDLRRDDPANQERFYRLGQWDFLNSHIIPIMLHYRDRRPYVYAMVKIAARMTLPLDPKVAKYTERIRHQQMFKVCV